jgi:uncharacterized protein YjbJ (UPF0337 family)
MIGRAPLLTPSMPGREAKLQMLLGDIHAKWGKLSDADLAGLNSRDDVVTKVMARYGHDRNAAEREVNALLEDRARRRASQTPFG